MRLKEAANWNQTAEDWRNVMRLAPDGCFGLDCDGTLVATTTAVCFGPDLAWIGMVLTHPDYRGRGLARRLMEHALTYLDGVAWIKLDATDMGRPLYLKLGFEDEAPVERWGRHPEPSAQVQSASYRLATDFQADRAAFGADRTALLDILASIESAAASHAFAMGRPGSKAAYFGPCVAGDPQTAGDLLSWFLARHTHEPVYWDLLPENTEALALAEAHGFKPLRKLVRMVRRGRATRPFPHDDSWIYAIAGFEYG